MLAMLGGFSEEALQLFQLAASEQSYEFSEGGETYDFTRCMRADGSFYGTRGSCKKGSAAGAKEKEAPKTEGGRKRRATAEGKAADSAARKAAGGAKRSASAGRARLLKEELDKVKDKMRGADSETQNRLLKEASAAADRRSKAGEAAPKAKPKAGSMLKASDDKRRQMVAAAKARQKERDGEGAPRLPKPEAGFDMAGAKAKRQGLAGDIVKAALKGDTERMKKLQAEALDLDKKITANGGQMEGRVKNQQAMRQVRDKVQKDKVAGAKEKLKARDAEAKPARKPRATTAETKTAWQEAERAVVDAKKKLQDAARETKGDQSVEARQRRLEAGRALDKAERAAYKASSRYEAAQKRENYAKMTPEQKKEEREWRKNLKKYG